MKNIRKSAIRNRNSAIPLALAAMLAMGANSASAANFWWDGVTGNWTDAANWSTTAAPGGADPASYPLFSGADTVTFNTTGTNANEIIYLNGNRGSTANTATITINNTGTTTFSGGTSATPASNTLSSNGITINAGAGAVTFSGGSATVGIRMGTGNAITNNSNSLLTIAGSLGSRGTSGTPDFTLGGSGNIDFTGQVGVGGTGASVAITKSGDGLLTLSGNNLYTSTTTINAGTVRVSHNSGLGTSASGTSVATAGGKLELTGGRTVTGETLTLSARATNAVHFSNFSGNNNWAGNIATATGGSFYNIESQADLFTISGNLTNELAGDRKWQLMGAGSGSISGNITNGSGGGTVFVNKLSGAGTWTLSGNNDYSGGTAISEGTIKVGSATALGTGTVSVTSGATLDLNGKVMTPTTNALTLNGTGVSGFGALINNNSAAGTYAGLLSLGSSSNIVAGTGDITLSNAGSITATGAGFQLLVGGAKNTTINGGIDTGTGTVFKQGGGILTLNGASSYSGLTTVSVGTLTVGNNSGLGTTAGDTTVSSGAALRLANGVTVTGETILIAGTSTGFNGALQADASATAEWAGTVKINSADARVGAGAGGSLKISGAIIDNAGFNILNIGAGTGGTGEVIISAASGTNTYSGNTTISRGTLKLGADNTLPTGTTLDVDVANAAENAIFDLNGFNQMVAGLQRTNTNGGAGGAIITNSGAADRTLTINQTATTSFSGVIQDGSTNKTIIVKGGSGTLTLSGSNTYTGATAIKNGTLALGAGNDRLPTGTTVTLGDGSSNDSGILKLDSRSQQLAGLLTAGSGTGNKVVNDNAAAATLTLNIASGTNSFGGTLGGSTANENNFALTKSGNGTLTLSGSNTYTGATTVSQGTLLVNGGTASGSAISINSGATLGGTGTISGNTTVGGTLNAGDGGSTKETLGFGGSLGLSGATVFDIGGSVRGTSYDGIDITGALTNGGTLSLNFTNTLANGSYTFDLFSFSSQSGSFSGVSIIGSYAKSLSNNGSGIWSGTDDTGNSWTFTQSTGDLSFTAVPELSNVLIGGLLGVGLLRRRRTA